MSMEMVSVSLSKGKTRGRSDKIALEDYLLLFQSHPHLHLTVPHLNQIISMHGYKKIHKVPKKNLTDVVSTLSLVEPSRSTLKEYISPLVITTLEDVIADLDDLNWQECCVTSIETLSSWKHSSTTTSPPLPSHCHDIVNHQQSAPILPDSRAYGVVSSPNGASLPSGASETAHPAKKLAPKRKRMRSVIGGCGADGAWDSVSYGSC